MSPARTERCSAMTPRNFDKPALAETRRLFPEGVELTTLGFLPGEESLVAGGSDGSVDVFFRLPRANANTSDGRMLVRAHRLEKHEAAVTAFDSSKRSRLLVTADAAGAVWVRHASSEQTVMKLPLDKPGSPWSRLALAPRDNAVLATAPDGSAHFWNISVPHPETTIRSIFGKIWYEGYPKPDYTWQSSSGSDAFEPKLSLVPLIFGTIKATVYSLLFAIPMALLGGHLHLRIRPPPHPRRGQADHGADGFPAIGGAWLPRRAGDRTGGRELDCGAHPRLHPGSVVAAVCGSSLAIAAELAGAEMGRVAEIRPDVPYHRSGHRVRL